MKKMIIPLLAILFSACSKDDFSRFYYEDETIYSQSNKVKLSEVVVFISPYIPDDNIKQYIVIDQLKNIKISIAGKTYIGESSYKIDTDLIQDKKIIADYETSQNKIIYPTSISTIVSKSNITTAGEYAELLSDFDVLPAGTYICQIQSFEINGKMINIPSTFVPITIDHSVASVNLGEFEIKIQ